MGFFDLFIPNTRSSRKHKASSTLPDAYPPGWYSPGQGGMSNEPFYVRRPDWPGDAYPNEFVPGGVMGPSLGHMAGGPFQSRGGDSMRGSRQEFGPSAPARQSQRGAPFALPESSPIFGPPHSPQAFGPAAPVQSSRRQASGAANTNADPLITNNLPLGARGMRRHVPGQTGMTPADFGRMGDPDARFRQLAALNQLDRGGGGRNGRRR